MAQARLLMRRSSAPHVNLHVNPTSGSEPSALRSLQRAMAGGASGDHGKSRFEPQQW